MADWYKCLKFLGSEFKNGQKLSFSVMGLLGVFTFLHKALTNAIQMRRYDIIRIILNSQIKSK
jgi:hypothetical protein